MQESRKRESPTPVLLKNRLTHAKGKTEREDDDDDDDKTNGYIGKKDEIEVSFSR